MTHWQRASADVWAQVTRHVLAGRMTPEQGAAFIELHRTLYRSRARRLFWRRVLDSLALGPVWRWLQRTWGRA